MFSLPLSISLSLGYYIYILYIMYGLFNYYIIEMTKFFHTESNRSSRVAMRLLSIGICSFFCSRCLYEVHDFCCQPKRSRPLVIRRTKFRRYLAFYTHRIFVLRRTFFSSGWLYSSGIIHLSCSL